MRNILIAMAGVAALSLWSQPVAGQTSASTTTQQSQPRLDAAMLAKKGYKLIFADEFSGNTLDTTVWRYRIDRRVGFGYMNGLNRAENVRLQEGKLIIDCRQEQIDGKNENTGGGIISKLNFGYGYYECLSKPFMAGRGVHSAFWQRGSSTPNNDIFEIDSYEIDSKQAIGCNNLYIAIGRKDQSVPWPHRAQVPFSTDSEGWFLDAYEYTPDGIIFYDNGQEVARADWNELNAAQAVWLTALNGCGEVEADKQPACSEFEYFRFYARDYPGVNILPNGNFEFNQDRVNPYMPVSWSTTGTEKAVMVVQGDASRDQYKLRMSTGQRFQTKIVQRLDCILNGRYKLSADIKSSSNAPQLTLSAYDNKGQLVSKTIKSSHEWQRTEIPVKVRNQSVTIAIEAVGEADEWIDIDNIELMKPATAKEPEREHKPFDLFFGDAQWVLAANGTPVEFNGDGKFYFFDRSVGLGDKVSILFDLCASKQANMTPIARIPKSGNSGWAVQLTDNGGLILRIGSIANHTDIYAPNVYQAGQTSRIACVFDKGRGSIYVNGELRTTLDNILNDTNDKTAAGRLGTVGQAYEAVGDVVLESKETKKSTQMNNFSGKLSNVKIYNDICIE